MKYTALLLLAAVFLLPVPALAQVAACGTPASVDVTTDPGKTYCDIYSRQLAYKDVRDRLSGELRRRQENYEAPRKQAYDAYVKQHEALWARADSAKTGDNAGNQ